MGTEVIVADGRSTPGDATIRSACETIIRQAVTCNGGTVNPVRRLVISNGFSSDANTSGYYAEMRADSGVCTDLVVPGAFLGTIVAIAGSTDNLARMYGSIDGTAALEAMSDDLVWACPEEGPESVGPEVIYGPRTGLETPLWTPPASYRDAAPWEASLDPQGFAGIFVNADAATREFLLVVCCRSTPLSRWIHGRLHSGDTPTQGRKATYADLVACPAYSRAIDISKRNACRMLYRAAAAVGIDVRGFPDDLAEPRDPAVPAVATRGALVSALARVPATALPDYSNIMDVFLPERDSVQCFNALYPIRGTAVVGGFISAKDGDASGAGIAVNGMVQSETARYFDGCISMGMSKPQRPPIPFAAPDSPRSEYSPLIVRGIRSARS